MKTKLVISSLVVSVAIALAAIIYIIVDKTSYCQAGTPNDYTAVSDEQTVVCLPGYVFEDGNSTHILKCDRPPYWNWAEVPKCFPKNETKGWKCPILSDSTDLKGEILFVQPSPSERVRIEGQISGLKKSAIQMIDVDVSEDSCYMTNDLGNSATDGSITIEGDVLRIQETIGKTMQINETFRFYVRAIGSQHVSQSSRADLFEGVVVFVLEQSQDTKGVYSASSTSTLKQSPF